MPACTCTHMHMCVIYTPTYIHTTMHTTHKVGWPNSLQFLTFTEHTHAHTHSYTNTEREQDKES